MTIECPIRSVIHYTWWVGGFPREIDWCGAVASTLTVTCHTHHTTPHTSNESFDSVMSQAVVWHRQCIGRRDTQSMPTIQQWATCDWLTDWFLAVFILHTKNAKTKRYVLLFSRYPIGIHFTLFNWNTVLYLSNILLRVFFFVSNACFIQTLNKIQNFQTIWSWIWCWVGFFLVNFIIPLDILAEINGIRHDI